MLTHTSNPIRSFDAIVVGGGPCGLAVVGNLLEQLPDQDFLWVDPEFKSGRVGDCYREVPSNTKADLFVQFAEILAPFRQILESSQEPNALTVLRSLPQDEGCELGYGADMCLMLTDGISRLFNNVQQRYGRVTAATFNKQTKLWTAVLDGKEHVETPRLILCTGSSPVTTPLPILEKMPQSLHAVHLDIALTPTLLSKTIEPSNATVAVIGASHSAILVLMNLYNLASTTHPNLRIKWFTRHKELRYAKYMDGWILYDNTGLKGQAARWARENLEEESFDTSPASQFVTKFWTPLDREEEVYNAELPSCTHIVQAIGYRRNALPELSSVGTEDKREQLLVQPDDATGRFFAGAGAFSPSQGQKHVPGLFGAGIAFPQRVVDKAGNVEHAVGFWKFMRFLRTAVPQWIESS